MQPSSQSPASPEKAYKGPAMEGFIARWYDRNRGASPDQMAIVQSLKEKLPQGAHILEIAPGPGHLSIELARSGAFQVTAVDISWTFVGIAKGHAQAAEVKVDFQQGNASALPFDPNTFDYVICVAAFKNFSQPVEALREMHRVLKPGGTARIIDLRKNATMEDIDVHINRDMANVGAVNRQFTRWVFKYFLLKKAYTKVEMEEMIAQTDFKSSEVQERDITLDISMTKQQITTDTHAVPT